jgi:hypothetical protein
MTLPQFKTKTISFRGGLNLESDPLTIPPGALILCKNYECKVNGGYRRIGGYERFDGRIAPSMAEDPDLARANILAVPGSGPILGVWIYQGTMYTFRNNEAATEAKMYRSSGGGWQEVVTGATLEPGGRFKFKNYNFSGASFTQKMYGVDGKNDFFSFDGTTFVQMPVAGFTTKPYRMTIHKNRAALAFPLGQMVLSGVGDPADYDTATSSAVLIATGGEIVGMRVTVGGALAVFMRNRVTILYGSTTAEFQAQDLRNQSENSGAIANTIQEVGDIIYLDDRGLTSLSQTQKFGNFQSATLDKAVKSYLGSRKDQVIDSTVSRGSNQYRLLLESPSGTEVLTLTLSNQGIEGFGLSSYPVRFSCAISEEDGEGYERIFVGSIDGMVYELDRGISFDGLDIESYLKIPFYHYSSPDYRKRFRRAIAAIETPDAVTVRTKPEFDYGGSGSAPHVARSQDVLARGGQWGLDDWNEFTWSSPVTGKAQADIGGTGENMALLFYHKGQSKPFTIYNVTIHYMNRRLTR